VRAEEKELEGPDLARAEQHQELHTPVGGEHEETELPEIAGEGVRDMERERGSRLIDAMREILGGNELNVEQLALPARELLALKALQSAVTGRGEMDMFVFAEDRKSLLEQALAVLQPNQSSGKATELAELSGSLNLLTKTVAQVREQLAALMDAQDELLGDERQRFLAAIAETEDKGDKGDKPAKPTKPSDPDAPRPASTVSGPGPEAKREERPSALSTGPEAKRPEHVSTVSGPGPEVKRAEQPTTLGDPAEIARSAVQTWWKKPSG
jgi:hypothetical protein